MGIRVNETRDCLTVRTGFPIVGVLLWIATVANAVAALVHLAGGATLYHMLWWAAVIVTMAYVSWLFGESSRFSFSRTANRFSWMHKRLLRKRHGHVPLASVGKARCDMIYAGGDVGDSPAYRLLVEISPDPVALTDSYGGSHDELLRVSDRINLFLDTCKRNSTKV